MGAATTMLATLALAGCGAPPELRQPVPTGTPTGTPSAPTTAPTPALPPATGLPSAVPTAPATPTTDAGLVAAPCRSGPSGQRVIQLLRGRSGVLPDDIRVQVRTGPLCAADWQYTVLAVTGHEELQVVTRGGPGTPELVTAGTDVCTVEVRATGPLGIRTLACDGGTVGVPGA
ncbi:hypothetical protein [Micromonospora sp. NPDC093243]|uniref:hypothetical protein n=2 Tax=unclassified Micromonospora TaxID=2617518 RepID=UPI0037F994FE